MTITILNKRTLTCSAILAATLLGACSDQKPNSAYDKGREGLSPDGGEIFVNTVGDDDDYWAERAQTYQAFDQSVARNLRLAGVSSPANQSGEWSAVKNWPLVAAGAANLADGRIVAWASTGTNSFGSGSSTTYSTIYNPDTNDFTNVNNSDHDMFCAGVSMLPDGNVFAAAGGATVTDVSIFDLNQDQWVSTDPMIFPRWYPTSATLASGQVFSALGTKATSAPELWTPGSGWKLVPGSSMQDIVSQPDTDVGTTDWYPSLYVAPNGSVFHPGPTRDMLSFEPGSAQGLTNHGARENHSENRLYGASVLYDSGKMLLAGGGSPAANSALTIDINGSAPQVMPTNPPNHARTFQNTLVMPDGKVLMIGGNADGVKFSDDTTILTPEMWDPDTGVWTELAPHSVPRNYHSTALLLRDGRVIAMGGGLCGDCATNHPNSETFSPPYLFDNNGNLANRPVIFGGTGTTQAGGTLSLSASDDITAINMIRLTGTTHHTNTDQRLIKLNVQRSGNGEYLASLPDNPNIVIPGQYWVFGLNSNGVPSIAHTVEVKVSSPLVNSSSHISKQDLKRVKYEYFEGEWVTLPNFDELTPVKSGMDLAITLDQSEQANYYGMRFTTKVEVPVNGDYTFYIISDDGSALYLNGEMLINHDGIHRDLEKSTTVNLDAGIYEIGVDYFENSGKQTLSVDWSGPQWARQSLQTKMVPYNTPVTSGTYTGTSPDAGTNPDVGTNPGTGGDPDTGNNNNAEPVEYEYFEGNWNNIPDFSLLTPDTTGYQDALFVPGIARDDYYAVRFNTNIVIPESGTYTFYVGSDDGGKLYINDDLIIDNDGEHRFLVESNSVTLTAGTYPLVLEFLEVAGSARVYVDIEGPGLSRQLVTPFLTR